MLTLFTYPLVLLPVRAALLRLDPALEDAARGMGRSNWSVARTVVLPQLIPAVGAGALLAALYALSDFGAVSILRFDSFTRVIYQSYRASFDRTGAAALAALLVLVMIGLLAAESRVRRARTYHRTAPGSARGALRPAPRARGAGRRSRSAPRSRCSRSACRSRCSSTGRPRASRATSTGRSSRPPPATRCCSPASPRSSRPSRRCPSRGSARASRAGGRPPSTRPRRPATRCRASSWRSRSSSSASARSPCSTSRSRCS